MTQELTPDEMARVAAFRIHDPEIDSAWRDVDVSEVTE